MKYRCGIVINLSVKYTNKKQGIHKHQTRSWCRNAASGSRSAHLAHYGQKWRHPSTRKYITYRNAARGRPSHGHSGSAQKFCEDWSSGSRDMLADRQTHTDRQADHNIPLPYRGGVTNNMLVTTEVCRPWD